MSAEQFTKADLLAVMLFADEWFLVWLRAFGGAKRLASWRRQLSSTVILLMK